MADPLAPRDIELALSDLEGWKHEDDQLKKSFTFEDFPAAIGFITRLAFFAEKMNHHPDLHNVYDRVDLQLTTHDAGGKVTQMDVELAKKIEEIARSY